MGKERGYNAFLYFFFFQAEDGIRDLTVTGVQTCALPISGTHHEPHNRTPPCPSVFSRWCTTPESEVKRCCMRSLRCWPQKTLESTMSDEIGRASCRERV